MASPPTQHKQNARTNQTWTRARKLDSGTKRCSITPGITAHASAAQQDLTHQICDLMTSPAPNSTTAYRLAARTRQTTALGKKNKYRNGTSAPAPTAGGEPQGLRSKAPGRTPHGDGEDEENGRRTRSGETLTPSSAPSGNQP